MSDRRKGNIMKGYMKRYVSLVLAVTMILGIMSCPGAVKLHVDAANGTSQKNTATDTDAVSISGLNAVPKSASSIQLKWKTIAGVDTYRIYVYDVAKKAYKEKGRTQTGAYQVSGLAKSGNEYKIAVRGYSADQGRIVAVTPLATITSKTLPGSPKLSELGARSTSNTYIKWNKVTGADGYQVYRYNRASGKWSMLTETAGLVYKDTNKTSAKGYTYKVRAYMKYKGQRYYGVYSAGLRTATVPKSVPESMCYENYVLKKNRRGMYEMAGTDAPYMYIHGYKLELTKAKGSTGYVIYYQDVREISQENVKKSKVLGYTRSSVLNLGRTTRKGYKRVFWVSSYYVYGGKRYVNPSRMPVTNEGVRYTYKNRLGKVTGIEEYEYGAVDRQISQVRYYTSRGRLNKYEMYLYNKNGFSYGIRTYNASGKLIKTERFK